MTPAKLHTRLMIVVLFYSSLASANLDAICDSAAKQAQENPEVAQQSKMIRDTILAESAIIQQALEIKNDFVLDLNSRISQEFLPGHFNRLSDADLDKITETLNKKWNYTDCNGKITFGEDDALKRCNVSKTNSFRVVRTDRFSYYANNFVTRDLRRETYLDIWIYVSNLPGNKRRLFTFRAYLPYLVEREAMKKPVGKPYFFYSFMGQIQNYKISKFAPYANDSFEKGPDLLKGYSWGEGTVNGELVERSYFLKFVDHDGLLSKYPNPYHKFYFEQMGMPSDLLEACIKRNKGQMYPLYQLEQEQLKIFEQKWQEMRSKIK